MRLKTNCRIREVAGEKIVVLQGIEGVDLTKVIMLNNTAEFLWNKVAGIDFSVDDIVTLIVDNFNAPQDQALKDALAWVASLEKAGLVE